MQKCSQSKHTWHLGLPVVGMVHRVRVQPLIVLGSEQDASLVAHQLTEEVLLFIIVDWSHIAW